MFIENQVGISRGGKVIRLMVVWLAAFCLAGPVRAAESKTLSGHVPAIVKSLTALGTLPETNRLNLAIGLPLRKAVELEALLGRLYDPASPDYRHYLTPEQFAEQFGPTAQDYETVKAFARQNNLTIRATHGNQVLLDVSGSVGDIQRAFHLTLKVYQHPTQALDFYAPDTDPIVDASLPIADISGLSNYSPPHPKSLKVHPASAANAAPRTGSGSGGTYMGNDFRAAYLPGVTLTGTGQTVGLLEFDGYYTADITSYETSAGLPAVPLENVSVGGVGNKVYSVDGNTEVSLDIEMAVSMAPGLSKVAVFEAGPDGTPNDILEAMASYTNISQFSSSWGWGGGPTTTTDNIFREMIAQGQSYFNAAGDSDAFTVGAKSVNGVDNTSQDNTPSSSPYVTQVGGTTLTTTGPGGVWSSETVWNWGDTDGSYVGTCGGVSSYYAIPTWQANVSMSANGGSTTYRNIPDVALTADNISVDYDDGKNTDVGGTSCATPLWAAFTALLNEQSLAAGRSTVGFINPALYALGTEAGYPASFHDITTGNNEWPSSPNNYNAVTGYDLCTGWGTPAGQSLINALAGTLDPLQISPTTGFSSAGYAGGPFINNSQTLTLANTGSNTLNWSVGALPSWLTVAPTSGALAVHATTSVTISLNAATLALPVGTNNTSLSITDLTSGVSQNLPVALPIFEPLTITPTNRFTASGPVGGPFSVASTSFTLNNLGGSPVNWSIGTPPSWLTVTPASGTLTTSSSTVVTASLNSSALALPGGDYSVSLAFNDLLGQTTQTRLLALLVGQSIVQNGGFETGTFTNWTLVGNTVTGNNIYDAVESASADAGAYAKAVHSGTYGAFLGDVELATLSQNLATVPGQNYLLSFWFDNPSTGAGQQFLVNWITNSATTSQIYYVTNPPTFTWTNMLYVLTATGTNTELQFGAENVPNYFGLDDISVTPIPNPAIRALTRSGNSLNLTLYTVAGVNYQLLYATNLAQSVWTPLNTNMAGSTTLTFTNNPGTDTSRFYRIRQLP